MQEDCNLKLDLLLEKLNKLFLSSNSKGRREILSAIKRTAVEHGLNLEEIINRIEAKLIESIQNSRSNDNITMYKNCLRLVLLHRGYYTGPIGALEQRFLEIVFENIPVTLGKQYRNTCWIDALTPEVMNPVLGEMLAFFDQGSSSLDIVEQLKAYLLEKLQSSDLLLKAYLDKCLRVVMGFRLKERPIEQSLWASATLEALSFLDELSHAYLQTTQSVQQKRLSVQLQLHHARATLYSQYALQCCEPIGRYAQMKLSAIRQKTDSKLSDSHALFEIEADTLETLEQQLANLEAYQHTSLERFVCFQSAVKTIVQHKNDPHLIGIALSFADQISHPDLKQFIRIATQLCQTSPLDTECEQHLHTLRTLSIPADYRDLSALLWLTLAKHFWEQDAPHETQNKLARCSITCCEQVIPHSNPLLSDHARQLLADVNKSQADSTAIESTDSQPNAEESLISLTTTTPAYTKQSQYLLVTCQLRAAIEKINNPSSVTESTPSPRSRKPQSARALRLGRGELAKQFSQIKTFSDQFSELIQGDYPYGLELMIAHLLETPGTVLHNAAQKTISEVYGEKYTNPLTLCRILKKQQYNRYLIVWYDLYRNALTNGYMAEEIDELRVSGLEDIDITYKLETYARSLIYSEIMQTPNVLIPGGCEQLLELDTRLVDITMKLIDSIEQDQDRAFYGFARNHPGLLEADFAQMAGRENNFLLMYHLAELSVSRATDALASPRPTLPSTEPSVEIASSTQRRPFFNHLSLGDLTSRLQVLQKHQNTPSYLGYFLLAVAKYQLYIKDANPRDSSQVKSFVQLIETSLKTTRESEYHYIKALILLNHINNDLDNTWLVESAFSSLNFDSRQYRDSRDFKRHLKTPPGQSLAGNEKEQHVYYLFHLIKQYLTEALTCEDMYPLAVWPYADELKVFELMHADGDADRKNDYVQSLVENLEKAIQEHGYIQALYQYAQVVLEHLDLFSCSGSLAEILEHIQKYLEKSERYIYIIRGQKQDLEEAVTAQRKIEHFGQILNGAHATNQASTIRKRVLEAIEDNNDLARLRLVSRSFNDTAQGILTQRSAHFSIEDKTPICTQLPLELFPVSFAYQKTVFQLTFQHATNEINHSGFLIQKKSDEMPGNLRVLLPYFEQAQHYYQQCSRQHLHAPKTTLIEQNDRILITHLDIAIIGIMKLCKQPKRITPMLNFLQLVHSQPNLPWGWSGTPIKLSAAIDQFEMELTEHATQKSRGEKSPKTRSHSMIIKRRSNPKSPTGVSPRSPRISGSLTSRTSQGNVGPAKSPMNGSATDIMALLSPTDSSSRSRSHTFTSPRGSKAPSRANSMRMRSKTVRRSIIPTSMNSSPNNTLPSGFQLIPPDSVPGSAPTSPNLKRKNNSVPNPQFTRTSRASSIAKFGVRSESYESLRTKSTPAIRSPRAESSSDESEDLQESTSNSSDGSVTP